MRVCCLACYHRRGSFVPATSLGDVWRCDNCNESAGMALAEAAFAGHHGGDAPQTDLERIAVGGGRR